MQAAGGKPQIIIDHRSPQRSPGIVWGDPRDRWSPKHHGRMKRRRSAGSSLSPSLQRRRAGKDGRAGPHGGRSGVERWERGSSCRLRVCRRRRRRWDDGDRSIRDT